GDTTQADESGQDGVVGGLGLAGLPGEHSLAHGAQASVDVTRVDVEGVGATVLVEPEPLGASVGPVGRDVGPAFGTGAVEEDERGCGVGREMHRRSEKPGGPPGRAAAGGPPWQRALLVAAENRSCPWGTTHWRMADSGRRCCVLYTTQPLASSPRALTASSRPSSGRGPPRGRCPTTHRCRRRSATPRGGRPPWRRTGRSSPAHSPA